MATPTLGIKQGTTEAPTKRQNAFLAGFRDLLEIIRDYGMASVAFGTGIYAFILVLHVQMAAEFKTTVALALTLLGLLAQLWIYSRENPRVQSDEVKDQLRRMTELVERLVAISIKGKANPD